MTRFIARLLLLAVFFNTAIGLPAHEAKHLPHGSEWAAGWQAVGDEGSESDDDLHALCEWCHAYAQAVALDGGPVARPIAVAAPHRFSPPASDPAVRSARPWTCASRDPPRA